MGAFIPLSKPDFSGNELKYVTDAVSTGWVSFRGSYEKKFEEHLSWFFGKPALATSSGTGALHLALLRYGIAEGDEVIVPNLTFGACASVVKAVGATPVFVDVKEDSTIDPDRVEDAITGQTKAIMPVHLYGMEADMPRINRIAKRHGLKVIEDSCEAFGIVNPSGDVTCFSFYANKVITTGEGGAIVGDLGDIEEWRNGGFDHEYRHRIPGLNYRMTNLQAAVGLGQVERLPELLGQRLRVANYYKGNLDGFGKWLFCVKTDDKRGLEKHLRENGVETRPVFFPLNKCPAYECEGDFPVSEEIWKTHLCIPTNVSDEEAEFITRKIKHAVY